MMAITTALDLIKYGLKKRKVLGVGDTLTDDEAQDCLDTLNLMLESFSLDRLMVYNEALQSFVPDGSASYTIGPGGDIDVTERPTKLTSAYTRDSAGIDRPMAILLNPQDYDRIALKAIGVPWPSAVWYEPTAPLGTLHFWPVPNGNTIYLRFWQQLQQFETLTETIVLPPGYKEAIGLNFAVRCEDFGGQVTDALAGMARASLGRLKAFNAKTPTSRIEASYIARRSSGYNIVSDGYSK